MEQKDKQRRIFERLVFGPFPSNLAKVLYSQDMEENDVIYITGNYRVQEPNLMSPNDPRRYFEHDVILDLVHCGQRVANGKLRNKIVWKETVSIEIKTSVRNVFQSSIDQYLGATRLFFVAAPRKLLPTVVQRYRHHPRKEVIGIIDSDAGQIVVLPQFQCYQQERSDRLHARCYTSEHRFPFCCDTEPYDVHRVEASSMDPPIWIDMDGWQVNSSYWGIIHQG